MALDKHFLKKSLTLPKSGETVCYDVISNTSNDEFKMDIDRSSSIELSTKCKLQNRYVAERIPLVRIDIDSPPHMNPDGTKLSRNHIHIYREAGHIPGKLPWACELTEVMENYDPETSTFMDVFNWFCDYCHIMHDGIQGVL